MAQEQEKDRDKKGVGKESPEDRERERAKEEAQTRAAAKEAQAREELAGALTEKKVGKPETDTELQLLRDNLLGKVEAIRDLEKIRELEAKEEYSDEDETMLKQMKKQVREELLKGMTGRGKRREDKEIQDLLSLFDESRLESLESFYGDEGRELSKEIEKLEDLEDSFEDYGNRGTTIPSIEVEPGGRHYTNALKKLDDDTWLYREVEVDDYDGEERKYSIIDGGKAKELLQGSIDRRNRQIKELEDRNREAQKSLDEAEAPRKLLDRLREIQKSRDRKQLDNFFEKECGNIPSIRTVPGRIVGEENKGGDLKRLADDVWLVRVDRVGKDGGKFFECTILGDQGAGDLIDDIISQKERRIGEMKKRLGIKETEDDIIEIRKEIEALRRYAQRNAKKSWQFRRPI